jgi:hypothetical protein
MVAVILVFGVVGFLIWDEPQIHIRVGLVSYAAGLALACYMPIWFMHRHVDAQNQLLDRCRALLLIATRAVEGGDQGSAEAILARIRRHEWLWQYGNAVPFRVVLALWAIVWAVTACILIRLAGLIVVHAGWTGQVLAGDKLAAELWTAAVISMTAPLHALARYFQAWKSPWKIDDCGDRLWQMLMCARENLFETLTRAGTASYAPAEAGARA